MYNNKVVNAICRQKIEQCFRDLYVIARFYAKKDFKTNENKGAKWDIARSLVALKDIANNPDKYFSFENTNAEWNARVQDYIAKSATAEQSISQYGIDYVRSVTKGSLVETPGSIVFNKINPLFKALDLWSFCENVQDFYYQKRFKQIYVREGEIIDFANKVAESAKVLRQENPVKRNVQLFFQSNRVR